MPNGESEYYDIVLETFPRPGPNVQLVGRVPLAYRGSRSATWVVAAVDATHRMRRMADYRCDGVDDDVEILAAIDALPADGGSVMLSEGTFYLGSPIARPARNDITLMGTGMGTRVGYNESDPVIDLVGGPLRWTILNMDLDAGGINSGAGSGEHFAHYWINGSRRMLASPLRLVNGADETQYVELSCDDAFRLRIRSDINFFDHCRVTGPVGGFLDNKALASEVFLWFRGQRFYMVNENDSADGSNSVSFKNVDDEVWLRNFAETAYGAMRVQRINIEDAIAVPDAIAGIAQIYVDTADGDLKVRFGDGTVKTLATNP